MGFFSECQQRQAAFIHPFIIGGAGQSNEARGVRPGFSDGHGHLHRSCGTATIQTHIMTSCNCNLQAANSEGVSYSNYEGVDLHSNMCHPSGSGAPPATQFAPLLRQEQQTRQPDISEHYLYSHSSRMPEVAYSCN